MYVRVSTPANMSTCQPHPASCGFLAPTTTTTAKVHAVPRPSSLSVSIQRRGLGCCYSVCTTFARPHLIVARDEYKLQQQPPSSTTAAAAAATPERTARWSAATAATTAVFAARPVHEPEHGPSPPATVGTTLRPERHEPRKGKLTDSSHALPVSSIDADLHVSFRGSPLVSALLPRCSRSNHFIYTPLSISFPLESAAFGPLLYLVNTC